MKPEFIKCPGQNWGLVIRTAIESVTENPLNEFEILTVALAHAHDQAIRERDEALDALRDQRAIWLFAAPTLNALDQRLFRVPFMELYNPVGKIDAILAKYPETKLSERCAVCGREAPLADGECPDCRH